MAGKMHATPDVGGARLFAPVGSVPDGESGPYEEGDSPAVPAGRV